MTHDQVNEAHVVAKAAVNRQYSIGKVPRSDREDLVQECLLALTRKFKRFDQTRGTWGAYAHTVCRSTIENWLRSQWRRRKYVSVVPFEDKANGLSGCQHPSRDANHLSDLHMDLEKAAAALPQPLAVGLASLGELPFSKIARRRGVSRDVVRGERDRLKDHFEQRGLGAYSASRPAKQARRRKQAVQPPAAPEAPDPERMSPSPRHQNRAELVGWSFQSAPSDDPAPDDCVPDPSWLDYDIFGRSADKFSCDLSREEFDTAMESMSSLL